jgi:hypothetical protein
MVTTAPLASFSDLDLSDPDEQMKVTNNSSKDIEWTGVRRIYTLPAKGTTFIPFHVCVRYLGDPRSDYRKTESFVTPTGDRGVIPERRGELIRLSVLYGLYHGKIAQLPKVAPKVTVTTMADHPIEWPINQPKGTVYAYQTSETGIIDARTEFDRIQKKIAELERRQNSLAAYAEDEDLTTDEAPEDTHPGV